MIRYASLFSVDILHDYFLNHGNVVHEALSDEARLRINELYDIDAFFAINPTAQSQRVMAGHQMIFKLTRTGFMVGVKTDISAPDIRPVVPLASDFRLTFALTVSDPRFFNYTEVASTASGVYRFSNSSGNAVADQLFLTAQVPGYDTTRAYEAGSIYAVNAAGVINLFRAVRDTGPADTPIVADWERIPADTWNPTSTYASGAIVLSENRIYRAVVDAPGTDLSDTGDWEILMLLANQYACSADKLLLQPSIFNLDLSGAALTHATVRLFRSGESAVAAERVYAAPSGTLAVVPVDIRDLAYGTYRLEVLDGALTPISTLGFEFYLNPNAVCGAWLGIIEIDAGSGGFALLDNGGVLRSPRYTIRFLNRSTRWRYIFPQAQAVGAGADVATEGSDPRVLVTDTPRPLTYFGTGIRLQADNAGPPAVSEEVLLPLPEPHRVRRDNQQWYSEIHMSNLSL